MSSPVQNSLAVAVSDALTRLGIEPPAAITIERPARPEHGDWATNAALVVAKAAGRNPRELAEELRTQLLDMTVAHLTAVETAGPGFLNFRLADSWLHEVVKDVVHKGVAGYGRPNVGHGRTVNVEYVSANPTGPLHAGHARWAAYGDALSRVLARTNHVVHREFYINDRGVQMQKFAESLLARQAGTDVPDGGYQGQYIRDWAAEMPSGLDGAGALEWGYAKALKYQQDTMRRMHVEFDTFSSERAIAARGDVESTLAELDAGGHLYRATKAENESQRDPASAKGSAKVAADAALAAEAIAETVAETETEAAAETAKTTAGPTHPAEAEIDTSADADSSAGAGEPATWLRTTAFLDATRKNKPFDDADRVLVKGDGQYTYFMPDIAYHRDKFNRGSLLIDILGADHHGYVGRMKAAVMALGHNPTDVEILIGQNCVLLRDGEVVKLSKRTGDIIELAEIIDEVGADAAKLTFLLQSIDTRQSVDLNAIVAQTLDNPVHYIHYAHARIHGISRKAAENGIKRELLGWVDLSQLSHESELNVARLLGDLNDVLTVAANDRAPHKVATWVRELAGAFQRMYHDCPILRSDVPDPLRQARLTLIEACRIGLAIGLDTLGVSAPERMDALETEDAVLSAAEVAEQAAAAAFPTAAVAMHLLPETASVGPNGRMLVAGVDMVGLAEEYGTPLFVYDEYHLRKRCRDAVQAFGSGVAYASKAFLCVAMAKLAHEEGMHIDVASAGEAYTALRAGVPAEKLVFHGNNKSTAELTYALEQGLGRIVIDCFEELERLKRLSNFGHRRPRVLLRLNPGVEAHTHEFIATGQEDSKFGFSISSGAARDAVFRARAADSGVELVGLHAHVGSNVTAIDSFEKIVGTLADFFLPLGLPELVIGGGLAAPYVNAEPAISITDWAAAVRNAAFEAGIPSSVLLAAEPGRSIVANAGMTLYRVGVIKDLPGIRTYVSIDGGMSDNIRPSLYGAQYEVFLPRAMQARREKQIRLVGKHCESGDIVAREAFVPNDIAVGDIVCTPVTGAYGYTMASNYNKLPRPAVVFVTEGRSRVVVRRESHEDLLRNDIF